MGQMLGGNVQLALDPNDSNQPMSLRDQHRDQSSSEDSSSLSADEAKEHKRWLFNRKQGHAERQQHLKKKHQDKIKQLKIDKRDFYRNFLKKPVTKGKDRHTIRHDEQVQNIVVDSSFEDEEDIDRIMEHVEGNLINKSRKVIPFPYQRDGRIGTPFWGKLIIQDDQFVDPDFPADDLSLFDYRITERIESGAILAKRKYRRRKRIEKVWGNLSWKRPEDVHGEGMFQIFGKVEASDVTQGLLGDCYFLASLSALAEVPRRIRNIFLSKSITQSGCYAVRLYVNGEPQDIVIDDSFPFDESPEQDVWAFSRDTMERELWVQILEKAYAKVFGSYEAIEGGKPYQALATLTGFPSHCMVHNRVEKEALWVMLHKACLNESPTVAIVNSVSVGLKQQIKKSGLADHHAYTVLSTKIIWDERDNQLRLVKIRDPYGTRAKREWHEEWEQESYSLIDQLKDQVQGIDDKLDGIFWMTYKNYLSYFYQTTICTYEESYQQICLSDTHGTYEHALTKLVVHANIKGPIQFKLHQCHKRFMNSWPNKNTYTYPTLQLYLCRVDRLDIPQNDGDFDENTEALNLIDGARGSNSPMVFLEREKLPKGEYLIFYRAAFIDNLNPRKKTDVNGFKFGGFGSSFGSSFGKRNLNPFSQNSSSVNGSAAQNVNSDQEESQMGQDEGVEEREAHPERKLVLSLNFPKGSKLQMQRMETEKYGKEMFLLMKHYYKEKYEKETEVDSD